MNNLFYNLYPLSTEIYLVISINILLIYGVFFSTSSKNGYPILHINMGWLSFQVVFFSILLLIYQYPLNLLMLNNLLISNFFTVGIKYIILLTFLGWFLLTVSYVIQYQINSFEYWILILLGLVALLVTSQAYDLLTVYITIEFQSLIFYVLATFKRTSEFSTEAGLKYFILGAFSSALLLFGSALLYSLSGLTNLGDFAKLYTNITLIESSFLFSSLISLIFILIALLFKLSAAPFHMWAPDVYEGSPTSITAFFSLMPKLIIMTLLIRILIFSFQDFIFLWKDIVLYSGLLSIFIGALGAFSQKKWKRFLSYSSINHVGFLLLALLTIDFECISSITLYLIIYVIMTIGIFAVVFTLQFYSYPKVNQTRNLQDLLFLSKVNPVLTIGFTLVLFSMAGIPPLAGFFSKLFILLVILQKKMLGSVVIIILISCITCFYYIRLIKIMYFDKIRYWPISYPSSKLAAFILSLSVFFIFFLFIDLEIISLLAVRMSLSF